LVQKEEIYSIIINYNLISGTKLYSKFFKLIVSNKIRHPPLDRTKKLITLNTSNYPKGIYIVRLQSLTEKAQISRKLIINH